MTITKDDFELLRKPFPTEQVEFIRGFAYIREEAISLRLSEVDPSWDFILTGTDYRSEKHAVAYGYICLKGVTRHNIGEQMNQQTTSLDAAKGAATDLLKRCARMFWVGVYLTELPDNVKDYNSYDAWYRKATGQAPKRSTTPLNQSHGGETVDNTQTSPETPQTAYAKAMAWAKEKHLDISKEPYPNNHDSEVVAREWCERVLARNQKAS